MTKSLGLAFLAGATPPRRHASMTYPYPLKTDQKPDSRCLALYDYLRKKERLLIFVIVSSILSIIPFQDALATTAFARQTGEPCTACHMQAYGPWLTQYGQKFKLDGYVAGHANKLPDVINPFALELVGSLTSTQQKVPAGQYYDNASGLSKPNNNAVNDWDALYYTGRITDRIGSYLQLNLNPQVARTLSLTMADIRVASHAKIKDIDITYGLTVNNAPTMSDSWMTAYAWMFPYTTSSVTVKPAAQPYLQSLMAGANTMGSTAYMMINNHLYLEAGGYTSQPQNMAQGLGVWTNGSQSAAPQSGLIDGGAPYWRMFLQHATSRHWMMIGTYGFAAKVFPFYQRGSGRDTYVEYNVDANYSYKLDDNNMFMAMARYTRDNMKMNTSQALGFASNSHNHLNSVMMMGMWTHQQTYNLAMGWNYMSGSADTIVYNGGPNFGGISPITGSANGSPNTNSFLFTVDYIPFGKGTSRTDPYLNLRLSIQYWVYTKFNGRHSNYDGAGRNSDGNNTLYFVGNVMF